MAIVGFRQDPASPPGAGFFKGSDGKEKFAYAPEIAAKFVSSSPNLIAPTDGPDMRMAMGDGQIMPGGPPPSRLDAGGGLGGGAPPPMPAPMPPPRAVPQAAPPPMAAPPMPAAPLGQPDPALAAQQEGVGNILRSVADAPTGPRRAAGWAPKGQSTTVEMGAPYSEEQANDRALAEANVQRAHLAATSAFADQQETLALNKGIERTIAQEEAQKKAAEVQARQQQYESEHAQIKGLMDATSSQQIDPDRWFSKNVFGGVMAVIGQAMQNFASIASGHGPTNAMLDRIIDRDIASQRSDIEQGRVKSGNALHMLNLQYRDLDQAQAALGMLQKNAANAEIQRQAALQNGTDAKTKSQEWLAQRSQEFVKAEQAFQSAAMGKTTIKTDQAYQPATGGGVQDPLARLKRMGEGAEQLRKMGVPEEQIAKSLALPGGAGGKDVKTEAEKFGKEVENSKANEVLSSLAPVEQMLNKYAGQETIPGIQSENIAKRAYRGVVDTVSGQGTAEKHLYGDEERNNRQTFEFMKADIRHAITGAGMSDTERKNLDDMVEKARTASDLRNAASVLKQRAMSRIDSIAQGYSPEARQLYDSRATPKAPTPERKVGP